MEDHGIAKLVKWGYEVKTDSDSCIAAINEYYDKVLSYGRKRSVILEAPLHDEHCVLANILAAHYLASVDPCKSPSYLQAAQSRYEQATTYEKAVFDAVAYLISDDRDDDTAVDLHAKVVKNFPRDLVSLKRAQILCFYMGQPGPSLQLVQQALPENQEANYIYGMLAFPLLELGRMTEAENAARKALEINKQDVWAHHCLCHVLQDECRFQEAVEFMEEYSSSWSACSSFIYTHNWWHVALCYLEGHSPTSKVLDVYDHHINKELEKPDAVPGEVYLNSLGLMMRLHVRGEIGSYEDHVKTLAARLTDKSMWHLEWQLDLLILWALASTGNLNEAQDLLRSLETRLTNMKEKKQQTLQKGLWLAKALYEYGRGNDEQALAHFGFAFDANNCKAIGASDEQLDVFNEVWYSLLLNTGHAAKAVDVIQDRLKKREGVPFLWRLLEKGYLMLDRHEAAAAAAEKANTLERAYFK